MTDQPTPTETPTPAPPRDPLLTLGASDPIVPALAQLLTALGHEPGPIGSHDVSVQLIGAVQRFRAQFGIAEDPAGLPPGTDPSTAVGPETWRALHEANAGDTPAPSPEPAPVEPVADAPAINMAPDVNVAPAVELGEPAPAVEAVEPVEAAQPVEAVEPVEAAQPVEVPGQAPTVELGSPLYVAERLRTIAAELDALAGAL